MDKSILKASTSASPNVSKEEAPTNMGVRGGQGKDGAEYGKPKYTLIRDVEDLQPGNGIYDKPLPCFGCGVGWFSFLVGFLFPVMWYYATFLYFGNYFHKDPRERAGLAASAIAASGFCIVVLIILLVRLF